MGLAVEVLADAGRQDAADLLGRAFRIRRARLQGTELEDQRDPPSRAAQAEILTRASQVLRERGQMDRAERVADLARQLGGGSGNAELDAARHQVELMRTALRVIAAAQRPDAADMLERAIRVRELALEGRREAAAEARAGAPGRGGQAELLMLAARLLRERGQEDRAAAVAEYGQQLAEQARRIGEVPASEPPAGEREAAIRRLEARLEEVAGSLRELQAAIRAPRQNRDG